MTTTYLFGKPNRISAMSMQRQAISMIESFFNKYNALTNKPVFTVNTDKVIVQVFYAFVQEDLMSDASINALGNALTRCWGRSVELRLIRLNHAALDSAIFAQYLSKNSSKYSFNRLFDMLKASLPTLLNSTSIKTSETGEDTTSHITGVKLKLSGRLTTQRSGPRQTVNANRLGSAAKGKFNTVDYSQYSSKNKLGAFTMKVWVSQSL